MRGRLPTPTAVLAARGSWRAKTRKDEPPTIGAPIRPNWISPDARKIWDDLWPKLAGLQIAGTVDSYALWRYSETFARFRAVCRFLEERGDFYTATRNGKAELKAYPQVKEFLRLSSALLAMEMQFGMTPASRARMGIASGRTAPAYPKLANNNDPPPLRISE